MIRTVETLTERGVLLRSLRKGIDYSTPTGRMLGGIFAALAAYERELMHERPRRRGRPPGRGGFGVGAHYCAGAALARMQCDVAVRVLLRRCPDLQLGVPRQALRRRPVPLLHGLESLPVRLR